MHQPEEAYRKNLGSHNGEEGETTAGQLVTVIQMLTKSQFRKE